MSTLDVVAPLDDASLDELDASFRGELVRPADSATTTTGGCGTARSIGVPGSSRGAQGSRMSEQRFGSRGSVGSSLPCAGAVTASLVSRCAMAAWSSISAR
jgi:hypothetical protein